MNVKITTSGLADWGIPVENKLFIAGPCSAESEEQLVQTAVALAEHRVNIFRAGVWKPRTRPGSFEGVGIMGLKWLKNASEAAKLPVTVEVAYPDHVEDGDCQENKRLQKKE